MKTLIYSVDCKNMLVECFKLHDVNELLEDAYEIVGTNKTNGESDSVTTATPQGAIALADNIKAQLG